jgi:hypothetical protein
MDVPIQTQQIIKNNLLYEIAKEWCKKNNIEIDNNKYIDIVSKKKKTSNSFMFVNQIFLVDTKQETVLNIKKLIIIDYKIKDILLTNYKNSKIIKKLVKNEF